MEARPVLVLEALEDLSGCWNLPVRQKSPQEARHEGEGSWSEKEIGDVLRRRMGLMALFRLQVPSER